METPSFDFAPLNINNPYTNACANTPDREDLDISQLLDMGDECCNVGMQTMNALPKYGRGKGKTLHYSNDSENEKNDESEDDNNKNSKENEKKKVKNIKKVKNNNVKDIIDINGKRKPNSKMTIEEPAKKKQKIEKTPQPAKPIAKKQVGRPSVKPTKLDTGKSATNASVQKKKIVEQNESEKESDDDEEDEDDNKSDDESTSDDSENDGNDNEKVNNAKKNNKEKNKTKADDTDNEESTDDEEKENSEEEEKAPPKGKEPIKQFHNKNVGRYKKLKLNESVELKNVPKNLPAVEPKSFALLNRQVTTLVKTLDTVNDYRFANFISHPAYYMFVVSKSRNSQNPYRVTYANCVAAVTTEYAANYQKVDHLVMVVSIEQFRFMISYNLLVNLNISIPASEDLGKRCCDVDQLSKRCFFNEVKDFEFKSLLIHTFQLDIIYARTKMILLFNALGAEKTNCVMETMNNLHKDELFNQLPVNLYRREATEDERYDISPYVLNIVNLSEGLKFKKTSLCPNDTVAIDHVVNVLRFWLREKNVRSADTKDKDCFFTYKYGSIVRLFYDDALAKVRNLTKLKKASNVTGDTITSYLDVSSTKIDSDNFLLVSTKTDERITIIKKGREYIWITSVISDIIASDIINAFKKHTHHVFNLNNSTRKEVNYKHNGLIKLMTFYTSDYLNFTNMYEISKKFNCNYKHFKFVTN